VVYGRGDGAGGGVGVASSEWLANNQQLGCGSWHLSSRVVQQENAKKPEN